MSKTIALIILNSILNGGVFAAKRGMDVSVLATLQGLLRGGMCHRARFNEYQQWYYVFKDGSALYWDEPFGSVPGHLYALSRAELAQDGRELQGDTLQNTLAFLKREY